MLPDELPLKLCVFSEYFFKVLKQDLRVGPLLIQHCAVAVDAYFIYLKADIEFLEIFGVDFVLGYELLIQLHEIIVA